MHKSTLLWKQTDSWVCIIRCLCINLHNLHSNQGVQHSEQTLLLTKTSPPRSHLWSLFCGAGFQFSIARTTIFTFIVKPQYHSLTQQVPHRMQLKPNRKNLTTHILCSIKQFLHILRQSAFFFPSCSHWNYFCYKQVCNMQNKHLGKKDDDSTKSKFWELMSLNITAVSV